MHYSDDELDALIEEATVDCYNDAEQATGLYTMIEENVAFPFETKLLGSSVTVTRVDLVGECEMVAICARGAKRQRVRLADLPLPTPPPAGAEWIAAYRKWVHTF
jgi:hypothetical protein